MNLPQPAAQTATDYPFGARQAWFALAMTIALMMVDYLDRQVIVSLFPHIKAAWGLSDKQLGALVSIVSVTVALAAPPVAILADRWSRVRSIVVMAVVWSLATISCLFTRNYAQLMVARGAVGLGEAGYGSVGAALIASLFPARLRAGLLAAFFASASIGSVLGVMLGGVIAAHWGWQAAFGVVGVPGLLLALLYLKVRDYRTVPLAPTQDAARSSRTAEFAARSLVRSRTMMWACLGAAAQLIVVSSIWAWLPSFLHRFHGMAPDVAGVRAAVVVLIGAAGSLAWGIVVDRVDAGRPRRKLYVMAGLCILTSLVFVPTFAATGSLSGGTQFLLVALGGFFMTCTVGPVSAIVIDVTHAGLRATGAAVLSLFQNLLGLAAGPFIAGALSDAFGLDVALTLIPLFGVLAAVLFVVASRSYEADMRAQAAAGVGAPCMA
ncbi:MAG TPA: MFS transporter [Steroidobacteraceae bacterium]|nr:MFS transporter [Steroidobacteraceae bacterium]